jgi:hypothetical protein
MTLTGIFVLIVISAAFMLFGSVLAWADYQTRPRASPLPDRQGPSEDVEISVRFGPDRQDHRLSEAA